MSCFRRKKKKLALTSAYVVTMYAEQTEQKQKFYKTNKLSHLLSSLSTDVLSLPLTAFFLIFSRAVFCAAPQLTERAWKRLRYCK